MVRIITSPFPAPALATFLTQFPPTVLNRVATRRDIFPPNICDRLAQLHDRGAPHSWRYTQEALREAFGPDYTDNGVGLRVSPDAVIGCGSAAQVYKGTIRGKNGEERNVAVKVLHPRFAELVERDLSFMKSIGNLLHSLPIELIRVMNLPRVTENFSVILRQQADLAVEGKNLLLFRRNFYGKNDKNKDESAVFFPEPIWMSEKVLVEDLVENSRPISFHLSDSTVEGWKTRKELAGPLLRSFLKMVFLDNCIHGDLHPGVSLLAY